MSQRDIEEYIYSGIPEIKNPKMKTSKKRSKKKKSKKVLGQSGRPPLPPGTLAPPPRQAEDDIPLPPAKAQTKATPDPFLTSFEERDEYEGEKPFTVPTQWDGAICWNPRKEEMSDMQQYAWDRWSYNKKLEDPRRKYIARYKWQRNVLCTQRFRSPEYERIVPGTCIPKANPWNYSLGSPGMFNKDAVPDQSGVLPGDNFVGPFAWNGEYQMNPALHYNPPHIDNNVIEGQSSACPHGSVYDVGTQQCVNCPTGSSYDYSTQSCTNTTGPVYNSM